MKGKIVAIMIALSVSLNPVSLAIAETSPAKDSKKHTKVGNHVTSATIEEAGVIFELPKAWAYKIEKSVIPTGQMLQRWVRQPIETQQGRALPGMVALATPVPKDSSLVLLTQSVLAKDPYRIKLGQGTECIKCVRYKTRLKQGTVTAISYEPPPDCREVASSVESKTAPCRYERVNLVGLTLEPSWVFRLEKNTLGGKMNVLMIHAIVDGKLLDVTFWYPKDIAGDVEDEIRSIVASFRKR